jgi:hypothetical protein
MTSGGQVRAPGQKIVQLEKDEAQQLARRASLAIALDYNLRAIALFASTRWASRTSRR